MVRTGLADRWMNATDTEVVTRFNMQALAIARDKKGLSRKLHPSTPYMAGFRRESPVEGSIASTPMEGREDSALFVEVAATSP